MATVTKLTEDDPAENEQGGGTIVSFINGEVITKKVGPIKSGPLFDYVLSLNSGSEAMDIEKVKKCIAESPVDYKHPLFGDITVLLFIAQCSNLSTDLIDLLLDAGYDIETTGNGGKTPLLQALVCGHSDKAKKLIERGANVHAVTPEGNAIYYAAIGGSVEMVEILLNKGVDLNYISTNTAEIAINGAMEGKKVDVVKYLLTQKIQPILLNPTPEKSFYAPLTAAVAEDNMEVVNLLIEAGAAVNTEAVKITPLIKALWRRNIPMVQLLLEKGAKCSDLENDELYMAAMNKVPEAVEKLIERGANPKKKYSNGRNLVHLALGPANINRGRQMSYEDEIAMQEAWQEANQSVSAVLKILAKHGLDFNDASDDKITPLMLANTLEDVTVLESCGASLTAKVDGNNLLHMLMSMPLLEIIEFVLDNNVIDINEKDSEGATALHLACKSVVSDDPYSDLPDMVPIISALLSRKADVNVTNAEGKTPLLFAITEQNYEPAKVLINAGSDLNVKDKLGNTVAHLACSVKDNAEQFLALLTKTATIETLQEWLQTKNNAGETPLDVAKKSGNDAVVLVLEGDFLGAASKGVNVFDFAKLNPKAIEKLDKGFELEVVDTSKYDLNTNQSSVFFQLAKEVIATILIHNAVADVVAFSSVCRQFKQWSDNDSIWKVLLNREYGVDSISTSAKKELAVKWHTDVNMKKGVLLGRSLPLNPEKSEAQDIVGYAHPTHSGVASMAFDSKSGLLFVGDLNHHIIYVDVKKAAIQKIITKEKAAGEGNHESERIHDLTVVSHEKTFLYRTGTGPVFARNFETDQERKITDKCRELVVSGDLMLGSNYDTNELCNWKTGEHLWSFTEGNSAYTVALKNNVAITGTGANGDTKVRFWDVNTKTKIAESESQGYATYLWLGEKYVVGSSSHLLECFEVETGKSLWRNKKAHTGLQIDHVAIDETSMIVASASGAELFVWDILTGKQIARLSEQTEKGKNSWSPTQRQYLSLAIKGNLIFGGLLDSTSAIEVWDIRRPEQPAYLVPLTAGPKELIVKDNYLLAGLMNNSVKIVNFNV